MLWFDILMGEGNKRIIISREQVSPKLKARLCMYKRLSCLINLTVSRERPIHLRFINRNNYYLRNDKWSSFNVTHERAHVDYIHSQNFTDFFTRFLIFFFRKHMMERMHEIYDSSCSGDSKNGGRNTNALFLQIYSEMCMVNMLFANS